MIDKRANQSDTAIENLHRSRFHENDQQKHGYTDEFVLHFDKE